MPLTINQAHVIKSVLGSIRLGIVAVDKDGTVIYSNSAINELVGADCVDVPADQWPSHFGIYLTDGITVCPPEQSPLTRAIAGDDTADVQLLIRNKVNQSKSIEQRWCSIEIAPLWSESGDELAGGVLLVRDISDEKMLSDEVARSNAALQQFATVAAHDLQEPLRSIAGFSEMLAKYQGDDLDEKSTRCLVKIASGIQRMQALINDLLNYSRIQTKPQELNSIDCNKIIRICIKSLDASITETGAQIVFDNLPTIMADGSQLSQLFQNLIGNALKFSVEGRSPSIRISAKRLGLFWLFSVSDNGIGIAPEFVKRIFGVFQRLHNAAAYPGTGIGLAICQRIVDRHGGKIWAESEPGVGTTFNFTIPNSLEENSCLNS